MATRTKTNGTFSSWSVVKVKGEQGISAKVLTVSTSGNMFKVAKDGNITPDYITLNAIFGGVLTGTVSWSISPAIPATVNGNSITIYNWAIGVNTSIVVTASIIDSGITYTDKISIVKVVDGTDTITAFLTNEAVTVPATTEGTVISLAGAETYISIYQGITDVTGTWGFSGSAYGCTYAQYGNRFVVTGVSVDAAYLDVTAARGGYTSITKRMSISKSKTGAQGATGATGAQGATGATGAQGARGPGFYTQSIVGFAGSFDNSTAISFFTNTFGTYPVLYDTITQFNPSNPALSVTRMWDGSTFNTPHSYNPLVKRYHIYQKLNLLV
jgi:hypothetical protein